MKVVRAVLNGEDEETGRKALRLVLTQLPRSRFRARLTAGVRRPSPWSEDYAETAEEKDEWGG
jgi:hypothetical protein